MNYSYYTDIFLGTTITKETDFLRVYRYVRCFLEKYTCVDVDAMDEKVKDAVCALCDVYFLHKDADGIQSESVDGYSVTRLDADLLQLLYKTAKLYLPAEYLYRGV